MRQGRAKVPAAVRRLYPVHDALWHADRLYLVGCVFSLSSIACAGTLYGKPSSLDQSGPENYVCWQTAGGQGHHLCTLPLGHTGGHLLPQLGRTRKRAPNVDLDSLEVAMESGSKRWGSCTSRSGRYGHIVWECRECSGRFHPAKLACLASAAPLSRHMGVKGLQSYVQNRLPLTDYIVELASLRAGAADAVVVDGMALIRKLYEQSRPLWKAAAQRLRPTRPPARPASTRSSSRQPPASASLCQWQLVSG